MALLKGFCYTAVCLALCIFFNISKVKADIIEIGNEMFFDRDINLFVNDVKIKNLPMNPIFYNDYLLVPSREIFEPLGAYVVYVDVEKTVYIIYKSNIIAIQLENIVAKINDNDVIMTVPPKIVNNKLLIPLRSVSEILGLNVTWDNILNSAHVSEKTLSIEDNLIDYNQPEINDELKNDIIDNNKNDIDNNIDNTTDGNLENVNNFSNDKTYITDILIPDIDEKQSYVIKLNNEIERFEKHLLNDNRLILDFYNTELSLKTNHFLIKSDKVSAIRTGIEPLQKDKTKTRVVFDLLTSENISIKISEDRKSLLVDFRDELNITNSLKNTNIFSYQNGVLKISKDDQNININELIEFDDYNCLKYSIILPIKTNILLKNKTLNINDNLIKDVSVASIKDQTHIIINENKIIAPIISEDENFIFITMKLPQEKYKNIVVIDAGHGGSAPGTVNNYMFDDKIILEKDITLLISEKIEMRSYFDKKIKVYLVRNDDYDVSLLDRVGFSSNLGDLFISIHVNAPASLSLTLPNGIETFYYSNDQQNSKGIESKTVAEIIQKFLIVYTDAKDRGVKTEPFVVIKENLVPAVLVETGFISNELEVLKLIESDYQQIIAEAIYKAVLEIFNIYNPKR